MATVRQIYEAIDAFAPFAHQESWDNSGLQVGSWAAPVKKAVLALDCTPAVLKGATEKGAELIITHHPLLFHAIKTVERESLVGRALWSGISVLSAHTNLDVAAGGVNDALARVLELTEVTPFSATGEAGGFTVTALLPPDGRMRSAQLLEEAGGGGDITLTPVTVPGLGKAERLVGEVSPDELPVLLGVIDRLGPLREPTVCAGRQGAHPVFLGRMGKLPCPFPPVTLAAYVGERLHCAPLRYCDGGQPVERVAVCGGAGSSLWREAMALGAQALVTSEIKHDSYLAAAEAGFTLVDAGHYSTEAVVLPVLRERLEAAFPQVEFMIDEAGGRVVASI